MFLMNRPTHHFGLGFVVFFNWNWSYLICSQMGLLFVLVNKHVTFCAMHYYIIFNLEGISIFWVVIWSLHNDVVHFFGLILDNVKN